MAKHDCGESMFDPETVNIGDTFGSKDCWSFGALFIKVASITRIPGEPKCSIIFGGTVVLVDYPKGHEDLDVTKTIYWSPKGVHNSLEESMMEMEE